MKQITDLEELKSIQLDVMQCVHDFCVENNIRYFLCGGTLIGAIRHDGYIPWDDDIDIYMPRPDYDKFMELFNQSNSVYRFVDFNVEEDYNLPFGKVYDTRTIMDEYMYKTESFGVYIDVFPIDGISSITGIRKNMFLRKMLNTKKAKLGKTRSFFRNFIMNLGKLVLLPFSARCIVKQIDKNSRKVRYGLTNKVAVFYGYGTREINDYSNYSKAIKHKFEDREFYIPIGYDNYLHSVYGDYMQLPPENKRVSHHSYTAWWKD
ncbi:MAG: phosphorylcholine transferase LicD [Bacteroides sp.]